MRAEDREAAAVTKAGISSSSSWLSFFNFGTLKDASTTWVPGGHANLQRSEGGRKSFNSRTVAGEWMFKKEIDGAQKVLAELDCEGKGKKKNGKACAAARKSISKAEQELRKMRAEDRKAAAVTEAAVASSSLSSLISYLPIPMGYLSSSWRPGAGAASVKAKGEYALFQPTLSAVFFLFSSM